jgi:hypothetical protein
VEFCVAVCVQANRPHSRNAINKCFFIRNSPHQVDHCLLGRAGSFEPAPWRCDEEFLDPRDPAGRREVGGRADPLQQIRVARYGQFR